ncbi:MAG: hypothetical protein R2755_02225 [Acidimicrobiales bacterium]
MATHTALMVTIATGGSATNSGASANVHEAVTSPPSWRLSQFMGRSSVSARHTVNTTTAGR